MADIKVNFGATGNGIFVDYSSCIVKKSGSSDVDEKATRDQFKQVITDKMAAKGLTVFNADALASIFGVTKDEANLWMYDADWLGDSNNECTADELFKSVYEGDIAAGDNVRNGKVLGHVFDITKRDAESKKEQFNAFVTAMPKESAKTEEKKDPEKFELANKDHTKPITKTTPVVTTPSTPTKEDYFSYSHSEQGGGGLLGGNAGLLALAGFAIFAGIGLSGGLGGGACRTNYYGYC